ncbi:hypothetical protein CSPX01_06450 [Colletotrichum filicis]|nr:hypothetical protein CSPX01_06450 [Colletotrichum filicis]
MSWPPEFRCVLGGPQFFVHTDSRSWPLGSRVTAPGVPGPEFKGRYRGTKSLDLKIPNRPLQNSGGYPTSAQMIPHIAPCSMFNDAAVTQGYSRSNYRHPRGSRGFEGPVVVMSFTPRSEVEYQESFCYSCLHVSDKPLPRITISILVETGSAANDQGSPIVLSASKELALRANVS